MYSLNDSLQKHYAKPGLGERILEALERAGKDVTALRQEDLAPVDEFHIRGRKATLEMGRELGLEAGQHVLDVGCGIGGPARSISREFGCRVTGVDLMHEYCQTAALLSRLVGLAHQTTFCQCDGLRLPFGDEAFDVVWTQHASMNIPDKPGLYGEMHRVLKPGGRLAIYDAAAGRGGQIVFPVIWARSAETSFLVSQDEMRGSLEQSGFEILSWEDVTEAALSWFRHMVEKMQVEGLPPLGIHVLMGAGFQEMAQNQVRNMEDGRLRLVKGWGEKRDHKPD